MSVSLVDYIQTNYPGNYDFEGFLKRNSECSLKNWREFAELMCDLQFAEGEEKSLQKSSTYAVCQEYLGKLTQREIGYSRQRGGIWAMKEVGEKSIVVTVRNVLDDLKTKYP